MLETLSLYLAFGALAGTLSGLFGIGGGVVIVPFLSWQLVALGFPERSIMVVAVATSLATIVVTSVSAVYSHHRRGAVDWGTVAKLAPGILVGSLLGSIIADLLPVPVFKLIFAGFLLFVALRMLTTARGASRKSWFPSSLGYGLAGLAIGSLSAMLGIGGGTMTVPYLAKCRYSMRHAVAISSACGFPIALAGVTGYIVLGWNRSELPALSLGYIYLPAFAGIVVTSVLFAPLGAWLAHSLPTVRLKRLFALALLAIGTKMLWPWFVALT
jgi:uncharacterized membrane protein YfcA